MNTDRKPDGTNPHTISFVLEADVITSKFECTAGSLAPCHDYRACGDEGDCEHESTLHPECWMQSWFDSLMAVEELHVDNEPYTLARVPIAYETQYGDGFTWSVDREPPAPPHPQLPLGDEEGGR